MSSAEGAKNFQASGDAYDLFMGRYSRPLAIEFADTVGVAFGQSVLDVGCGPGALTGVLVERLGSASVAGLDPSPSFVAACRDRFPDLDVRQGAAEAMPFADASFDGALAQLVLHFVTDPAAVASELRRVVRPGGFVAANVWDFADGMQMLRRFWDAALAVEPTAPDEARTMRFGREGEIVELFVSVGLVDVVETMLHVTSTYADFDELWSGFMAGIGPAGAFLLSLPDEQRAAVRTELFGRLGAPTGSFTMAAKARCVRGRVPA